MHGHGGDTSAMAHSRTRQPIPAVRLPPFMSRTLSLTIAAKSVDRRHSQTPLPELVMSKDWPYRMSRTSECDARLLEVRHLTSPSGLQVRA